MRLPQRKKMGSQAFEGGEGIMRTFLLIIATVLALADFSLAARAAEQKQTQKTDQWRYTFRNGRWWYWLPEARWVYWQNNQWNDYSPSASRVAARVSARADTSNAQTQVPCILCTLDAISGTAANGRTQSEVAASAGYVGPLQTYSDDSQRTDVGPLYGRSGSTVAHRALLVNSEAGPNYGKADTEIKYPAVPVNAEIGPFYGKAVSMPESMVDMGHFPDY
jgi:hypothetical protein